MSNLWNSGYALPKDIDDEDLPALDPKGYMSWEKKRGWSSMGVFGSVPSSPGSSTPKLGSAQDPIANFGRDGAVVVMRAVKSVPQSERMATMRTVLDAIDTSLWDSVASKTKKFRDQKGYDAAKAMEHALASTFAESMAKDLVKLGKTKQMPTSGLLGLGTTEGLGCCCRKAVGYGDLGSVWGGIKKVGGAVASGAKTVGGAVASGAKTVGKTVASGAKTAGSAVKNAAVDALKGLSKLACKASNSSLLTPIAAAAGTAVGGPAGGAAAASGGQILSSACRSGGGTPDLPPEPSAEVGGIPMTPILLAGGAIVAVMLLKK